MGRLALAVANELVSAHIISRRKPCSNRKAKTKMQRSPLASHHGCQCDLPGRRLIATATSVSSTNSRNSAAFARYRLAVNMHAPFSMKGSVIGLSINGHLRSAYRPVTSEYENGHVELRGIFTAFQPLRSTPAPGYGSSCGLILHNPWRATNRVICSIDRVSSVNDRRTASVLAITSVSLAKCSNIICLIWYLMAIVEGGLSLLSNRCVCIAYFCGYQGAPQSSKKYGPKDILARKIGSFEVPGCSILYSQPPSSYQRSSGFKKRAGSSFDSCFWDKRCRTSFALMSTHAGLGEVALYFGHG
jgi:hypothetical protein